MTQVSKVVSTHRTGTHPETNLYQQGISAGIPFIGTALPGDFCSTHNLTHWSWTTSPGHRSELENANLRASGNRRCGGCGGSGMERVRGFIFMERWGRKPIITMGLVYLPAGARVRPPTNYWVSYQPTIGYLTNQLTTFLLSIFPPPPWQPMLLVIQVQVQHSFYQCFPPPWQPMFSFRV